MIRWIVTYKRTHNFEVSTQPLTVVEKNIFERELLEDKNVEYAYATQINIIK